ncbi:MAG: TolC family outer membrane protein [Caulobacteraceae bacterium]
MFRTVLIALGAAALAAPPAAAMTLDQAIASALQHDPGLKRALAERDAASARLQQARAGQLPSLTLSGSASAGSTDFGPFFGYGRQTLHPSSAQITLQQPVFAGGGVTAGIDQAKAGQSGARSQYESVRLGLIADVAEAFEAARRSDQAIGLNRAEVEELALFADQAQRRFAAGDAPRTDVDRAQARLAQAHADLARAEGAAAQARARFQTLVGQEPQALQPPSAPPPTPGTLDEAVALARANNPALQTARSTLTASQAGVRRAEAERLPTVALVAEASSVRDQFLPGYRADGATVGVQGRWSIFSGGLIAGRIDEARAARRGAEAGLDRARDAVDEAVIDAWQALHTADAVAKAAAAQTKAADSALDGVKNEVRVGTRPAIDQLDAEREALAAKVGALQADADLLVAAYRLNAVIGR